MQIGIPAETVVGENRVAATPETVKKLISAGHSVVIERRAGVKAAYIDSAYEQVGATLTDDAYTGSQMILKVRAPQGAEIQKLAPIHRLLPCLTRTVIRSLINLHHNKCLHLLWSYCHELYLVRRTWTYYLHKLTCRVTSQCFLLRLSTSACSQC